MRLNSNRAFDHWLKNKGERRALAWTLSILWLLLIGFLAFFWKLGSTGLVDETEPLFAEAARQMTVTGDWITPFFNGETRFDKPILIYWCQAIAYKILGVNSFSVRLPSALSAMGLTSLGFYTLWSFGVSSPNSGVQLQQAKSVTRPYWLCAWLGSAVMALNPETIVWARIGVSDMLLTGCMGGALLSFFLGYAQPSKPAAQARWYLAFYVLIALAVLTKGPVGIVLPGLIIGAFLLYLGNLREVWREMRPFWGGVVFLLLVLPWYILVIRANGWTYINSFFGYHNFQRFTTVLNHNGEPWYFYLLMVLVGFAPWSIYLPVAIARLKFWQRCIWRSSHRSNQLGLFALFWFVGVLGFFTIALTKLPSYVLPLMPAAAILMAVLSKEQLTSKNTSLLWSGWLNVVFLLLVAGASFSIPYLIGYDPAIPNIHSYVQNSGLPVKGTAIWAITAVAVAVLVWHRQWRGVLSVNLLGLVAFVIFMLMPGYLLLDQARQLPLRQLSAIAAQAQQPGEALIMIGFKKPSVVFYTQRRVNYISSPENAVPQIKKIAVTQPEPPSLLILSQPAKLKQLGLQPSEYQDLGKAGAYELIRVSKSEF
jgi:4-amino-4-deoxy-L-arabinose transferase-like glycosyltransferase